MTARRRSRVVPSHNHTSFDVQELGVCPACDNYHERLGVDSLAVMAALVRALERKDGRAQFRLLRILRDTDVEAHREVVGWFAEGFALAEAVDEAMAPAARELGLGTSIEG